MMQSDVSLSCKDGGGSAWFCREMKSLCQQFEDSPADLELIQQIISSKCLSPVLERNTGNVLEVLS